MKMPEMTITINQESCDKLKELQVVMKRRWEERYFPYYPDTIERVARHVLQDAIRQLYFSFLFCSVCHEKLGEDGKCHNEHCGDEEK